MLTCRANLVGIDPVARRLIAVPEGDEPNLIDCLEQDGFAIVRQLLNPGEVRAICTAIERDGVSDSGVRRTRRGALFARRNLLDLPVVRDVIVSAAVQTLVKAILGGQSRAVRGILFDKTPQANWLVPWHQDLSIAVRQRRDLKGFGPWSVKAGVHHVQPPVEVLRRMMTVRIHLDACPGDNGPLRVIPGSHRSLLTPDELERKVLTHPAVACCAEAGDSLLMRPLLVHTSAPARRPAHRRVIHIEFAGCELPAGLEWHAERITSQL